MDDAQINSTITRIAEALEGSNQNELMPVVLTALLTIFVFVVGLIIDKVFITPIQKQRELRGQVAYALSYYANVYQVEHKGKSLFTAKELNEKQAELRRLACDLRASRYVLPFYTLIAKLNLVIPIVSLRTATTSLIGWSNYLGDTQDPGARSDFRKKIAQALDIELE